MRNKRLTIISLSSILLTLLTSMPCGAVSITKDWVVNKDENTEATAPRHADEDLSVYFEGDATCSCCDPDIDYKWYFGDGSSSTSKNTSHNYAGGTFSPYLYVKCNQCGDTDTGSTKTLYAIEDIQVDQIGEDDGINRLCFNTHVICKAIALPAALPDSADNLIDWHLQVETDFIDKANDKDPSMTLPTADWPDYNFGWGSGTLYISIDGPHVTGQEDELITGSASFVYNNQSVDKFYNATGTENPTSDKNWFYYYKDEEGSMDPYNYSDSAQSYSTSGGGMSSVYIANDVYNGQWYWTYDYGNPGGLLRCTGTSGTTKYYATFLGVLAHETQHATNQINTGPPDDDDNDRLADTFETGTSQTNPNDDDSAEGLLGETGYTDREFYANGPVEKTGIDGASTTNDWAHPGTNWN